MQQVGSDMLLDSDHEDKLQDVATITPEDSMDDVDSVPRADDFPAMFSHFLPQNPDLETEAEAVHTWDVEDWRSLPKRAHGPVFHAGGHPWRILLFPAGNGASEAVSFYLEQGHAENEAPENWYACAQFMIVLWNPHNPEIYVQHTANHRYTVEDGDWGFTRFAEKNKIFASRYEKHDRPLVESDAAKVTAYVRILKDPTGVLWHNFVNYDSKKETGMVGLRNQGATCYLNSLLQSLYFTNAFRKAVYQIPTEQETEARNSSAWSLQRLFYKLQTDPLAVSTAELTQSFGWESRQIFEQQDVQELSRILMEKMEEKMKGTEAENALAQMFVGKMKTYLTCINVDYESSRVEEFWDLQMNVSGCKTLDDSFRNYVEVETLEGDNKYHAEGFGLQDAKKGVIFETFPSVLHLQLKRFEYDFQRDMMVKVNDRYEFPEVWDASPYLSETSDKSESYIYHLHGVLVHSGDMNAGHYYAFLKPEKHGDFYKFDDDRVTRATKREAMDENFGGDYGPNGSGGGLKMQNPFSRTWSTKRSMSAYMLVYIRETRLDQILPTSESIQPPKHLPLALAEERATIEKRKKEREEAHLYMLIQVMTETNLRAWQGFDLVPWDNANINDPAAPRTLKRLKTTTLAALTREFAEIESVDPALLRPWSVVNRQNATRRPDRVLSSPEMTIEEAATKHGSRQGHFKIFFEQSKADENGKPAWTVPNGNAVTEKKDALLFLKYFDIDKQTLTSVGHIYMDLSSRVADVALPILSLMGWKPGEVNLELTEEIKQGYVEVMPVKKTLADAEIQHGDIICFRKILTEEQRKEVAAKDPTAHVDAASYYDYLANRVSVKFAAKPGVAQNIVMDTPDNANFDLFMSKRETYDGVATKVAAHLSEVSGTTIDPAYMRFTTVAPQTAKPKTIVKRAPSTTLSNILYSGYTGYTGQGMDALFYEVLEMSLTDLEQRKLIKVTWLSDGVQHEEPFDFLAPKDGVMSDIIAELQVKASMPDEAIEELRFVEVSHGKVYKILANDAPVASINEYTTIYAERTPKEDLEVDPMDPSRRLITCFHYDKEPAKYHGVPFIFTLIEGETFKDTKVRLEKRTKIKSKQFEKVKFSVIRGNDSYARAIAIDDDEEILIDVMTGDDQLGLDHMNKTRNALAAHERLNIR